MVPPYAHCARSFKGNISTRFSSKHLLPTLVPVGSTMTRRITSIHRQLVRLLCQFLRYVSFHYPSDSGCELRLGQVERALESWKHGKPGQAREFSRGNWGLSTDEYIDGLNKISETRWKKILSETQQFTPYKPREVTATPEYTENYRTKAPESGET